MYICKKEFSVNDKKYQKVRDHCRYTGKYRGGAAHDICNLTLIRLGFLKVVFRWGVGVGGQFDPLPLPFHISRRTYLVSI